MSGKIEAAVKSFAAKQNRRRRLASYLNSDRRPWRTGYSEYKEQYLEAIIGDEASLALFLKGNSLPEGYGFRLDARVIEIPWVLARLARGTGLLLDAGSSLNHGSVLRSPALADKRITIVTLAPESRCYWNLGVSYMFGDLRELDFRKSLFDEIVCISTIEHVGMDNTMYAGIANSSQPRDTIEFLKVVQELKRVLKPEGTLYMTFPFGQYENHGWFQQFDARLMDELIEEFAPSRFNEAIFRYDPDGWKESSRLEAANCQFFDVRASKYFDPASTVEYPPDFPAGERAVACLKLHK